ncbi:hypothetical protein JXA85_08835 [Candidatus Woesearchaeota archaeon]|nr:hypothetical protein [Candidatus Woesearchaeota archaeon]
MAVGIAVKNPIIAVHLALISHFVLDLIPHWQLNVKPYRLPFSIFTKIFAVSDFLVALALTAIIAHIVLPAHKLNVILCSLAAMVPDFDDLVPQFRIGSKEGNWFLKIVGKFSSIHDSIQCETRNFTGVISQLGMLTLALAMIL